jgi:hypothetical protein
VLSIPGVYTSAARKRSEREQRGAVVELWKYEDAI